MATKTITVRVEEDVKEQAEIILDDIGLTVTALFNACLKALVREKKVPFVLVSREYELQRMIRDKLEESQSVAVDPEARRYTHDEIFSSLRDRFNYEVQN